MSITFFFLIKFQEDCNYNSAEMSKDGTYYVLTCGGPGIPQVTLHRASDHSRLRLIEDNQEVGILYLFNKYYFLPTRK